MNDPFGKAISDYFIHAKAEDLKVNSNYTQNETIPVSYFFREWNEMPKIEQKALELCRGKILDVGAAAGCHSIVLQNQKKSVSALEISPLAIDTLKQRGVNNVIEANIFEYRENKFDTILLLMNGAGIGKTVSGIQNLFKHLRNLLNENGQILIDSSDIKYLFEEEDGSLWVDLNSDKYYGEMFYEVEYQDHSSSFQWLFIDFELLTTIANKEDLMCKLIEKGEHFDYLAQITLK